MGYTFFLCFHPVSCILLLAVSYCFIVRGFMDISKRLAELISQRGITQTSLAEFLGCTPAYVSLMLSGKKHASMSMIEKISDFFGITLSEFFASDAANPPHYILSFFNFCKDMSECEISALRSVASLFPSKKFSVSESSQFVSETVPLPLLGSAAAGLPISSPAFPEESVMVPPSYGDPQKYYAIRARGDSMFPLISDGDYVIVKHDSEPKKNDLVLVRSEDVGDDGYVVKILHDKGKSLLLNSVNPQYHQMTISSSSVFSIEQIVHIIHVTSV